MKALWASVLLFGLLLLFIVGNYLYIQNSTDRLYALVRKADTRETRQDALSELKDLWERCRTPVSLSVHLREIDRISEILDALRWYQDADNEKEFQYNLVLLTDAIEKIGRANRFSLENIF